MAGNIYFVTATSEAAKVKQRLQRLIPDEANRYELAEDKWFVTFEGTTQELAEKAGVRTEDRVGTGLVLAVTTYSGRASTTLWDWLRKNGL
jgi:hypothetical protein